MRPYRTRAGMRRVAVGVLGCLVIGSAGTPAQAAELRCGDEIFGSVTLRKNLTGCRGSALVIKADDVTIKLNGFKIVGDAADDLAALEAGIDNSAGHSGVIVDGRRRGSSRRGTITGFDAGVFIGDDGDGNTATRLRATGNNVGVEIEGDSNTVTRVAAVGNTRQGILLDGGSSNLISRNVVTGNGDDGIFGRRHPATLDQPVSNTIEGNTSSGNGESGVDVDAGQANVIDRNVIEGNEDDGIDFDGGGNFVRFNEVRTNGESGVDINNGSSDVVSDNRLTVNQESGIDLSGGGGGSFLRNQLLDNGDHGMELFESDNNTIDGNTANGNRVHGIRITDEESDGNDISNNVVRDNGTPSPGDDFGLGIDAEPDSTVSGGGNVAQGNDDPRECVPFTPLCG